MAKKLDILVTRYQEPWEICKPLFDSIALQQGINFDDIGVIVVNDGRDSQLNEKVFANYPFKVEYKLKAHDGVSAARNFLLDRSKAEYVMFCDIDDMFLNNYGLHLLFSAMQQGFDTLSSPFVEEAQDTDGNMTIVRHDKDHTFIHGKVHNREFLIKNNIRFDNDLVIHEDGYFISLVQACAERHQYLETPFYLWKWNPYSVVRRDTRLFVLRTYHHLMKSRIRITRQFFERGMIDNAIDCVVKTFLDSYYDFNKPDYLLKANKELADKAEKAFAEYYNEFKEHYQEANITRIAEISNACRINASKNGFFMEERTMKDWLKHIATIKI